MPKVLRPNCRKTTQPGEAPRLRRAGGPPKNKQAPPADTGGALLLVNLPTAGRSVHFADQDPQKGSFGTARKGRLHRHQIEVRVFGVCYP